ncbi:hypothetical protein CB1_000753009 [Camelus ferus]|nr:hypothetical protein CB1_000753009 [Camelus ferus]
MLFEKYDVNSTRRTCSSPFFARLFTPSDDATAFMTDTKFITWSPVCHNDVTFLVGPDGVPVRRHSRRFLTIDIEPDIEALLSQGPSCA